MSDVHLNVLVKDRTQSREIVKEILNFGVNENQKLDIIYMLSLSLESNDCMKSIANVLKNYREDINKKEESNIVNEDATVKENKILLS